MKPMLSRPEGLGDLGRVSAVGSRGQGRGWEGAGPGEGPSLLSEMGEQSLSAVQPVHGQDPLPSQQEPPNAGQRGQRRGQAWPGAGGHSQASQAGPVGLLSGVLFMFPYSPPPSLYPSWPPFQIGRASCRERV